MRDGLRLLEPVALVLEDPPTSSPLPLVGYGVFESFSEEGDEFVGEDEVLELG
ncbi:hypothetical protein A2U01_0026694 [Trifolium medium]|uniref:Uncharacterized protein n=1 Tax=Trifolium medium TaxID=97028 RepID=A0A392P0S0_9FABA|nr:hypothetical protein [Trifolium medium]